jgi:hypothetical protein
LDVSSDQSLRNFSESVENMNTYLASMESFSQCGITDIMRDRMSKARGCAETAGIKIPDWSTEKMKSGFFIAMSEHIKIAQEAAISGDVQTMLSSLLVARDRARGAEVELPTLCLENVGEEARSNYSQFLEQLKAPVRRSIFDFR